MYLFTKDRNDFTSTGSENLLNIGVNNSGNMYLTLSEAADASNVQSETGGSTLSIDTWYYLVYSLEMTGNKDTLITMYLNNSSDSSNTQLNLFYVDPSDNGGYLAAKRDTASTPYVNRWNGYIYEFHLYLSTHDISNTTHSLAGCTSGCSTLDFDVYDSGNCDGTNCTDRSCVKAGECQATADCEGGTFEFCHLCADRECKYCINYTSCDTGKCTQTTYASESGGVCSCNDGYGRSTTNNLCAPCHTNCKACDVGSLTNYSDCLTCNDDQYQLAIGGYFFCSNYCPTLFTSTGSPPGCT